MSDMRCDFCPEPAVMKFKKDATEHDPAVIPVHSYCWRCFGERHPDRFEGALDAAVAASDHLDGKTLH